jgi:FMN phosphatase YigB (HAD superfamily)
VPLRAVTFDFFDTLFAEWDLPALRATRLEHAVSWLRARGVALEPTAVRRALGSAQRELWTAAGPLAHVGASSLVLAALAQLGVEATVVERAELVDLFEDPWPDVEMQPAPGIHEALHQLLSAGVRLGIVSNTGLRTGRTTLRHLSTAGLAGYFNTDAIAWSDAVGWMKPDPRIFHTALGALRCTPESAAHVGDSREADVAGALGVGMTAIRYRGLRDDQSDGPEGHLIVADHRELVSTLASRFKDLVSG